MIHDPNELIKEMISNPKKINGLYSSKDFLHKNGSVFDYFFYYQNNDQNNDTPENIKQIKRKKHRRKYRTRNGKRKNKH